MKNARESIVKNCLVIDEELYKVYNMSHCSEACIFHTDMVRNVSQTEQRISETVQAIAKHRKKSEAGSLGYV